MVFTKVWYLTHKHPKGMKGKKFSLESRKKMSDSGRGRKHSEETKLKISLSRMGEKHPLWKGDDAKKGSSFHEWVRRRLVKPERCQICNKIPKPRKDGKYPLDLANISHKYSRDLSDWQWLCKKCHMEKDGISKRLREFGNKRLYSGEKSPRWLGGTPKCIDCGKHTSKTYKAIRCRECYLKLKVRGKRKKYGT